MRNGVWFHYTTFFLDNGHQIVNGNICAVQVLAPIGALINHFTLSTSFLTRWCW